MIRLVTRCDDAASSRSANYAIREACYSGVGRNIGVMACCAHVEHAYDVLGDLKGVAFGCHFTINAEWTSPRWGGVLGREKTPDLYDKEGYFYNNPQAFVDRKTPIEQMIAEAKAQIAKLRGIGFKLTYLDMHMCANWLPGLNDALVALCKEEGLINGMDITWLQREAEGFAKHDYAGQMLKKLNETEPGTYLVLAHPTFNDDEIRAVRLDGREEGWLGPDREGERLLFSRPDVVRYFEEKGIAAIRYDER